MQNISRPSTGDNYFDLNNNQNLTEAIFYAERGFAVFPNDDKHSECDASTNIEELTKFWSANPHVKCALALGPRSGLIALAFNDSFMQLVCEAGISEQDDWLDTWRVVLKDENRWDEFTHGWRDTYL